MNSILDVRSDGSMTAPGRPPARRIWRRWAAIGIATVSTVVLATAVRGALAPEGPSDHAGLRGILTKEIPDGLTAESFTALTGNWAAWGKETAALVKTLYTDDKLDAAGQRSLLEKLRDRIHVIDLALADPRYVSLYEPLASLRGRLLRHVDFDLAILKTLDIKPADIKALRVKAAQGKALGALAALESDLSVIPNGSAWLPYLKANELQQALSSGKSNGVVSAVQQKLNEGSSLKDPNQRQFVQRPSFKALSAALNELQQAEHSDPADPQAVRSSLAGLVSALEEYEDNSGSAEVKKVRQSLDAVRKAALDGGYTIGHAVREHYMNYNLQVLASAAFLNQMMGGHQTTCREVTDYVLGSNVSGQECTTTDTSIVLRPGQDAAVADIVLNGTTDSRTVGVSSQASIYTNGNHHFTATKPLIFDGIALATSPAQMVALQPHNTVVGASTRYSGGLFGGMADRTAVQQAEARRGETEAIAAERLQSRVLPEFDGRTNERIAATNSRLQAEMQNRLKQAGIMPKAAIARSSESYLRYSAAVVSDTSLAGDVSSGIQDRGAALVLSFHESLLNAAISQAKFAGQTMTDAQIRAELERYLTLLMGRPFNFAAESKRLAERARMLAAAQANMPDGQQGLPPGLSGGAAPGGAPGGLPPGTAPQANAPQEDKSTAFIFDKEDPIRFRIDGGEIRIIARVGFKQEGKPDIPVQTITVPLRVVARGGFLMLKRGTVGIQGGDIVRSGVMKKKIETAFEGGALDGVLHVPVQGRADIDVPMTAIGADDGWLTIWAG